MKIEEFIKGMTILGRAYGVKYTREDCELWYEFIGEYPIETFRGAIKTIVKTSKYAPKIADVVSACEEEKVNQKLQLVNYMGAKGYFKQASEKDKALLFIREDNIPHWLEADMDKYYSEMKGEKLLGNGSQMLLKG